MCKDVKGCDSVGCRCCAVVVASHFPDSVIADAACSARRSTSEIERKCSLSLSLDRAAGDSDSVVERGDADRLVVSGEDDSIIGRRNRETRNRQTLRGQRTRDRSYSGRKRLPQRSSSISQGGHWTNRLVENAVVRA